MTPQSALMTITTRPDVQFVSGNGSWLKDSNNQAYLDFVQGWAVNCLGHCPPELVNAVQRQAETLFTPSPAYHNQITLQLANRLRELTGFDQVNFVNSGAEANEAAFKLARKWGSLHKQGAYRIITFKNGFHGRTLAAMSACGKPAFEELYEPKVPGFDKAEYNNLASVEALIGPETVAIMLEPLQGEGGVVEADRTFMHGLRALANKHKLLLIFDEVQTGMGRTGTLFAYQRYALRPDIITLGKGLGGGIPIAAMLAMQHCCCFEPGDQGSTFGGNPLCSAAGLAVLERLTRPGFLQGVAQTSEAVRAVLSRLSRKYGLGKVRGSGLLLALETHGDNTELNANQLEQIAREQHQLLINAVRPHLIRVMPALNLGKAEIQAFEQKLDATLSQACASQTAVLTN